MRKVLYIFGLLTDRDVDWLVRNGVRRRVADGATLIEEGRATPYLIVLLEGHLAIRSRHRGALDTVGPGEILGEMSLVDSSPPSATVAAEGEATALFVDKVALLSKLKEDEGFASRLYHAIAVVLADRLRGQNARGAMSLSDDEISADELGAGVLDNVSAAGERFRRMLADTGNAGMAS